jgi:ABC-type multidrug transport system ATPase subunit/ABC-type multidrug transport system permease subunit
MSDTGYELTKHADVEVQANSEGKKATNFTWKNVNFSVRSGDTKKDILVGSHGEVAAGETCAILGPSGAGKSSILNVLAGRSAPAPGIDISGDVKVGGKSINPVSFRRNIAYVMQDDSLMATSTPRESLYFSARLRLDPITTDDEIKEKVDTLITKLGLDECADVLVGGEMIKGISGGQRKRTSVGLELITDPSLLFLDEPTSGLDSFSASSLVKLLKNMAINQNTAVLCTIHQPSAEVFLNFDKVIFMKQGRIFYSGRADAAADYCTKIDMPCPIGHNIADHIMMLTQSITHEECVDKNLYITLNDDKVENAISDVDHTPAPQAGFFKQFTVLFQREFNNVLRDKTALIARFGITIFLNMLFGCIFYLAGNKDNGDKINMQNHFGAITMVSISSMFGSAQPVMLSFPFERPMFMREYSTGTYSGTAYSIVKTLVDVPLTLLTTMLSWCIAYFMIDLQGNYWYMVLAAWGLGVGAASIGMMVGCAVTDVKTVSEMAPVLFVPQLLFAGFFIATEDIPVFLRWAQWLCGIKYAMNLILLTEFDPENDSCTSSIGAANACAGVLESNDINSDDTWIYILMLLAIFIGFRVIAVTILVANSKRFY